MYTIYCHIFPNKKRYIGLTKTSLRVRWENGKKYKTCPLVNRAINKYGWENINHEILGEYETKQEAEIMERIYIIQYKTNDPKYGYNILPGGDVASNEITDDMRIKLGNGWRGKHRTEEEKELISQGVKRTFTRKESNGHFGMHHSNEAREKMSKSHKQQWENRKEWRKSASSRMKERWNDPVYREKMLKKLAEENKKRHEAAVG